MAKEERCWAESVSPCAGPISGEHYISAGLFRGTMATIEGLGGDGSRQIAVDKLIARCLCTHHNTALSALDQAAIDVANALRYIDEMRNLYARLRLRRPPRIRLEVSGALFERWALKAAAGFARVKFRETSGWRPSDAFARATFGHQPLPTGCGLAWIGRKGDRIAHCDGWSLGFGLRPEDTEPSGMLLGFMGWRFMLSWQVPFSEWRGVALEGEIIDGRDILRSLGEINFTEGRQEHSLRFFRDGRRASRAIEKLRKRYPAPDR